MSVRPSVSIVVVTHNEGEHLLATVDAFRSTAPSDAEIVVVDDFSTDESIALLVGAHPDVRVARPPRRLGASAARNFGAALTTGSVVLWADAHVRPPLGWWDQFAEVLERPEIGAVGPGVSVMGDESVVGYGMRWKNVNLEVDWLPRPGQRHVPVPMLGGCFLAMRREVLERTGGFDDGLIVWGGTDVELCFRLWTLGLECHVVPDIVVAHLFRRRFPYQVDNESLLHNLLRIAFVHFDELRVARVVEAKRSIPDFPRALARVVSSDVWSRRDAMRQVRKVDDESIFRRFPMPGLSDGQVRAA